MSSTDIACAAPGGAVVKSDASTRCTPLCDVWYFSRVAAYALAVRCAVLSSHMVLRAARY
eukprot:1632485-Rhodomonas_salina.1